MKILIVDDTKVNLAILGAFCTKKGHTVVTAENGAEAVEQFSSERPELILMDVSMPIMDGFEATSRIKACTGIPWVPVIMVTALEDDADLVRGIESGADDYLTKPVNLTVLGEKIKIMERILRIQGKLNEKLNDLRVYRESTEEELSLVAHVMDHMSSKIKIDPAVLQKWNLPTKVFSGDVIAAAVEGKSRLKMILGDATGHGLSAALCMMPATSIFYGMIGKGFSIGAIAREINQKVGYLLPVNRFIAATLVSIDWLEKTIDVWNGGGPSAVFVDDEGHCIHEWKSKHIPLGIESDENFSHETECHQWEGSGQLFVYSDGLIDARNPQNEFFGREKVMRTLLAAPALKQFETLKGAVLRHLGGPEGDDDISLVAVRCHEKMSLGTEGNSEDKTQTMATGPSQWCLEMELEASDIKKMDVLPIFLAWLKHNGIHQKDRQRFFTIFSELYNNALDHGLLSLDSKLKSSPSGFEEYLRRRSERLLVLKEGSIDIRVEHVKVSEGSHIKLSIKDSGAGFNVENHLGGDVAAFHAPSGRGIQLVKKLSKDLSYLDAGSRVEVSFLLKQGRNSGARN